MGAGDCPQETKAQLLQQVLDLHLGFPEAQLRRAIDHLVKEFGSCKEAVAWIPRDNFTILVNYILDNNADLECQQSRSPARCEEMKKMGNLSLPSAQGDDTGTEETRKGGNPPTKGAVKRFLNGYQSGGNTPSKVNQSANMIQQPNNTSPPQRRLVDRNELRKHYKKKLCTEVSDHSTDFGVSKAGVSTTQTEHINSANPSGHFIPNKKSRSSIEHAERMISKVAPLQRTDSVAKSEDQKTRIKRESDLDSLMKKSSSSKKNGKIPDPEATKELVLEARTLIPSGCKDLATGPGSPRVERNKIADSCSRRFSQNQGLVAAHDDRSHVETVAQQSGEKEAAIDGFIAANEKPKPFVGLDEAKKIPTTSSALKSMERGDMRRGAVACRPEKLLSNNDRQKGSCSVLDGGPVRGEQDHTSDNAVSSWLRQKASCSVPDGGRVKGEQDHTSDDAESSWLLQLEAFLKEGNCQRALEVLKEWKQKGQKVELWHTEGNHLEGRGHEMVADIPGKKRGFVVSCDISRGLEKFPISCVNEYNTTILPENFLYVTRSVIRQAAHVDISFSRIGDLHCCCSDDCLRSSEACKCTDSTRGEYAYDRNGRLIERLATIFQSGCTTQNGDFITECCDKCRCSMNCGNRIVQRGITRKLQVFMTPTNKGWGVRALETIPARSFLFEYLGEIATNLEQFERNLEYAQNGVYTYTMCLDADLDMEKSHFKEGLNDNEALVLDATIFGNVSRFVNHRCNDANLFMRPVQIETRDTHYYHAAFFAARDIQEMEELTWDYGIDFQDDTHQVKAFQCCCKSSLCRDKESPFNRENSKKGKNGKSSHAKHKGGQYERR